MLTSKRLWLNVAAIGVYVAKGFGFDIPAPDPAYIAVINVLLTVLRTRFGI